MPSAGNRQRLPHEVGEGNSKGKTKIFEEKCKSIDMVKQKVVTGAFRHFESKSGHNFEAS